MATRWGKPTTIGVGVLALVHLLIGEGCVAGRSLKKKVIGRWQPVAHRLPGEDWQEGMTFYEFMEFREDGTIWSIHKSGRIEDKRISPVEFSRDRLTLTVDENQQWIRTFTWGLDEDGYLVLTALPVTDADYAASEHRNWPPGASNRYKRVEAGEP